MGGGTDVDSAFQWLIRKSGGGDSVVLRASIRSNRW
jgi:cyanophycinase